MNTPNSNSERGDFRRRLLTFLGISFLAVMLLLGFAAYSVWRCIHIGSDTAALRAAIQKQSAVSWDKKFEFSVGALTVGLARTALSFIDEVPKEARMALSAVRGVEAGIYELRRSSRCPDPASMLKAADEAMNRRGWERVVTVVDRDNLVAVFVGDDDCSTKNFNACVVVLDGRNLVVASGRANLEPLAQLAMSLPEWRDQFPRPVQLAAKRE